MREWPASRRSAIPCFWKFRIQPKNQIREYWLKLRRRASTPLQIFQQKNPTSLRLKALGYGSGILTPDAESGKTTAFASFIDISWRKPSGNQLPTLCHIIQRFAKPLDSVARSPSCRLIVGFRVDHWLHLISVFWKCLPKVPYVLPILVFHSFVCRLNIRPRRCEL